MLMFLSRIAAMLIRGGVLCLLWRWFVATPFQVMPLTLAHALGLSALIQLVMFTMMWSDVEANAGYEKKNLFLVCFVSIMTLVFGFLVSFFM